MPEDVSGEIKVTIAAEEGPGAPSVPGVGGAPPGVPSSTVREAVKGQAEAPGVLRKFLPMIAGVAGVFGIIQLVKQSKILSSITESIFGLLGAMIDVFLAPFIPLMVKMLPPLIKVMERLQELMTGDWKQILKNWIAGFGEGLIVIGKQFWDGLTTIAGRFWEGLKIEASAAWINIEVLAGMAWAGLARIGIAVWTGIKSVAVAIWKGAGSILETAKDVWGLVWIKANMIWDSILTKAKETWNKIWDFVKSLATGGFNPFGVPSIAYGAAGSQRTNNITVNITPSGTTSFVGASVKEEARMGVLEALEIASRSRVGVV